MTREELLNKEVIKVKDIMSAFDCNYNKATQIIRAIKAFNDRYKVRGAIHVLDYMEYWEAKSKRGKV